MDKDLKKRSPLLKGKSVNKRWDKFFTHSMMNKIWNWILLNLPAKWSLLIHTFKSKLSILRKFDFLEISKVFNAFSSLQIYQYLISFRIKKIWIRYNTTCTPKPMRSKESLCISYNKLMIILGNIKSLKYSISTSLS